MKLILFLALWLHLSYYIFLYLRMAFHSDKPKGGGQKEDFSLVVCFKNEEDKVDLLMEYLHLQDIPEIILVDDHSTDGTLKYLQKYKSKNVKIHSVTQDIPGKKLAAKQGADLARYDRILMTDADCKPASTHWSSIMNNIDKPIVLGYSPMIKETGLVNLFSRFETYLTAIQYLSYAKAGIPYMGVGRNILLDKSLKQSHESKIKGQHLASGDDDLTVNAIATLDNVGITLDPNSFVYTRSKKSFSPFIRQKLRHVSTSTYYKPLHQVLLAGFSGSQVMFYLILIIGLCMGTISTQLAIIALIIKWVATQFINWPLMGKLKERDLFWKFPFLDILLFLYYLLLPLIIFTSKKENHWS